MQDPDPPRVGRVARDGDEVDLDVDVADRAGEVGEEDQRALEHADEHDAVGVLGGDLRRQALDALPRSRPRRAASPGPGGRRDRRAAGRSLGEGLAHRVAEQRGRAAGARGSTSSTSSSCRRPRASGLRWRTYGISTCPNSTASRSAKVRYMRRWRASMPRGGRSRRRCGRPRPRRRRTGRRRRPPVPGPRARSSRARDSCASSSPAAATSSAREYCASPPGAPSRSSSGSPSSTGSVGANAGATRRRGRRRGAWWPSSSSVVTDDGRCGLAPRRGLARRCVGGRRRVEEARLLPRRQLVEPLLDHLQREEVLLLLVEDPPQPREVVCVELPVARRRALGVRPVPGSRGSGSSRS